MATKQRGNTSCPLGGVGFAADRLLLQRSHLASNRIPRVLSTCRYIKIYIHPCCCTAVCMHERKKTPGLTGQPTQTRYSVHMYVHAGAKFFYTKRQHISISICTQRNSRGAQPVGPRTTRSGRTGWCRTCARSGRIRAGRARRCRSTATPDKARPI